MSAARVGEEIAAVLRASCGEEDSDYLTALENLAVLHRQLSNDDAAEATLRTALAAAEKAGDFPGTANFLEQLADLAETRGRIAEAEKHCARELALWRSAEDGRNEAARCLGVLARLCLRTARPAEAEGHLTQELEIRRHHPGAWLQIALSLTNLAEAQRLQREFEEAAASTEEALALYRAHPGEEELAMSDAMHTLATVERSRGDYHAARADYLEAIDLRRKAVSGTDSRVGQSLHALGELLHQLGRYGEAEPLLNEALAISGATLGEQSRLSGVIHNALGAVYFAVGNHAKAEVSFSSAVAILDSVDPDSLDAATARFNLARLLERHQIGARVLFQKAVDSAGKRVGKEHPMYATFLLGLAGSLEVQGDPGLVEHSFREAMDILRRAKGYEQGYAAALRDFSAWHYRNGQFAEAARLLREALEVRRQRLGEEHPDVVSDRWSLGSVLAALGRWDEALEEFRQAASAEDHVVHASVSFGSEQQRTAYLRQHRTHRNLLVALALRFRTPDAVRAAFDYVIKRKALSFELSRLQRDFRIEKTSPGLALLVEELRQVDRQIIDKVMSGPGADGLREHQRFLAERYEKKNDLESRLARAIPEVDVADIFRASAHTVCEALPQCAVLVEFVRVQAIESQWAEAEIDPSAAARYVAFVVSGGHGGQLALIDLGDAKKIDRSVASLGTALLKGRGSRERNFMVAPPSAVGMGTDAAARALATAVLWPLAPHLRGFERLFIAPDGEIARIPLEILPLENGPPLIDSHCLSYLGSARDLLRFRESPRVAAVEPIVIGDPDFDLAAPADDAPVSHAAKRDWASLLPGFSALPGTRDEALRVAALLKVGPWLQHEAVERRLRDCKGPQILHIATHGFFLAGEEYVVNDEFTYAPVTKPGAAALSAIDLGNPLLRSGLALAGVNTWMKGGSVPPEAEDGILTSADAAQMNLAGTELVVLSACDTGLGESLAGEGVWGFRRAFFLAGARSLTMSLWKVDDGCVAEIMMAFYERLLAGESRAGALRNAQLAVKARHPDPYYWGAFICEGDPGPLQPLGEWTASPAANVAGDACATCTPPAPVSRG